MDRVAGQTLDKLWNGLSAAQKLEIVQQLKESIDAIRSLSDSEFSDSIANTKPRGFLFDFDEPIDGPSDTEEPLVNGLVDMHLAEDPERRQYEAGYDRKSLMKKLKGDGRLFFTHCDLHLKKIMLQPDGRIAIIDWAAAGWYPVYWEYVAAIGARVGWNKDWYSHINLFLDEYPNHYLWMNGLLMYR
ncbi:hypothetical protein SEPCBS119000_002503 [Sporothrix epigloea]|uniref:Aminoglycoside phosphotransferase domain-containing protein n=1 Tax=Sporothrix epigloea TaxID=1892477 RepID=A0ABP0DGI2_9PEZI